MAPTNDHDLVSRINRGEEEAFAALVREHHPALFDYALSITRVREDAEDVVQDVLLDIWRRRQTWDPGPSIRPYLFRSVRNRSLNRVTRGRARRLALLDRDATTEHAQPDHGVEFHALAEDYRAAIEAMPERRRAVFRLVRLFGLSYEETGAVLDVSANTVRTQMSEALRHMRVALAHHID